MEKKIDTKRRKLKKNKKKTIEKKYPNN